jgi:hypothetical protein
MDLAPPDLADLRKAKALLENPGMAARITHLIGMPIEKGFRFLPANWHAKIGGLTQAALLKAIKVAVFTMKTVPHEEASNTWHKIAVAASGGIGGFFGLPALSLELPASTAVMLRSIADIARSEGEDIRQVTSQLACMEVFAFGGLGQEDRAAESGYFVTRAALTRSVAEAAEHIARKGLAEEGAPALVRFVMIIAQRFGIQVSEKMAAQSIPAIGAIGGALINTVFMDHFQDMARGHFIVRRLERKYGQEVVKAAYQAI